MARVGLCRKFTVHSQSCRLQVKLDECAGLMGKNASKKSRTYTPVPPVHACFLFIVRNGHRVFNRYVLRNKACVLQEGF